METMLGLINPLKNIVENVLTYLTKPRLEIYYSPEETYHKAHDYSRNKLGIFCHLMVKNKGRTVAKRCVGELRSIKKLVSGDFKNVHGYRSIMQLKWAHELDYLPKDIDETPVRLDLCYVHEGDDILHFFTKKYPNGSQTSFLPGQYLVEVRVKSDNAKNSDGKFIIEYNKGSLDNLKIKKFN